MTQLFQKIRNWIRPQYNELMTYQSAIVCILLSIAYPELRISYKRILGEISGSGPLAPITIAMSFITVVGIGLSIWHVFIQREKTLTENYFMSAFVLFVNGMAGIAAGSELFSTKWSILTLFPLWNILLGIILLYQMALENNVVTNENATLPEVVIVTVFLLIVFGIGSYLLDFTWAMIFSICVAYASTSSFIVPWVINNFHFQWFPRH